MGQSQSAEIFGHIFRILAENPDRDAQSVSEHVVELMSEYDFHPQEMEADAALIELGFEHLVDDSEVHGEEY